MFPSPAREGGKSETLIWPGAIRLRGPRDLVFARAHEPVNGAARKYAWRYP
jgi:hypothetical protein